MVYPNGYKYKDDSIKTLIEQQTQIVGTVHTLQNQIETIITLLEKTYSHISAIPVQKSEPASMPAPALPDKIASEIVDFLNRAEGIDDDGRKIQMPKAAKILREHKIEFEDYGFHSAKEMFDFLVNKKLLKYDGLDKGNQPYIRVAKESSRSELENFAYMRNWTTTLSILAKLALDEPWCFPSEKEGRHEYTILYRYLTGTYIRLKQEEKIYFNSSKNLAAFNTGLLSRTWQPIYALFEPNSIPDNSPWKLKGFCCAGTGLCGQELVREFPELPKPAKYFTDDEERYFDPDTTLHINVDHLLNSKNLSRLPLPYLENLISADPSLYEIYIEGKNADESDYQLIHKLLKENDSLRGKFENDIKNAADVAKNRARGNTGIGILMWYIAQEKVSFLLPLCLTANGNADAALVVERANETTYQGKTLLNLRQAYNDARLISRQDGGWLTSAIWHK